jgi:hypothetical protein
MPRWNYKSNATSIYNISDLELHALEQTVTISHITMRRRVSVDPARPCPTRARPSQWWIDVIVLPPMPALFLEYSMKKQYLVYNSENRGHGTTPMRLCTTTVRFTLQRRAGEVGAMNLDPHVRRAGEGRATDLRLRTLRDDQIRASRP